MRERNNLILADSDLDYPARHLRNDWNYVSLHPRLVCPGRESIRKDIPDEEEKNEVQHVAGNFTHGVWFDFRAGLDFFRHSYFRIRLRLWFGDGRRILMTAQPSPVRHSTTS